MKKPHPKSVLDLTQIQIAIDARTGLCLFLCHIAIVLYSGEMTQR